MNKWISKLKFEHMFTFFLTIVLVGILFYFSDNTSITIPIVTALLTAYGGIISFMYTKHVPVSSYKSNSKATSEKDKVNEL